MRAASLFAAAVAALLLAPAARAEDTSPPVISYSPPAPGASPKAALTVSAKITDESKFFPQLFFRNGPGAYEKAIDMKKGKGKDIYEATIPYRADKVEFYIEAYDEFGNGPARGGDPDSPFKVTLGEAPPPPPPVVKAAPAPSGATAARAAPSGRAPAPAAAPSGAGGGSGGGRLWTWVAGGTGLGLLTGGLLAGMAVKTADDAYTLALAGTAGPGNQTTVANTPALAAQLDANKSLGTKATILTITGAVLLAGAVGLWFFEAPPDGGSAPAAPGKPGKKSPPKDTDSGDAVFGQAPADHGILIGMAPVEGGAAAVIAGRF